MKPQTNQNIRNWTTRLGLACALLFLFQCITAFAQNSLPPIRTVFIIISENTPWSMIKGSSNAPYINTTLMPMSSYCEFYDNVPSNHPSLPNYLWIESGTNFGITDDNDPTVHHQNTTNHLVTQLNNAGISWKAYQENISGTWLPLTSCCGYSSRHNPFLYFDDVTGTNNNTYPYGLAHIRPFTELIGDLTNNTVARYNFIIPSDCNDMHTDCSPVYNRILQGDQWLSTVVPMITNSAAFTNHGVLFVMWDESYETDTRLPFFVVSPLARGGGYCNYNYYTHSSLLRTLQEIFCVRPFLGGAATAGNLADLFDLPRFSNIQKIEGGAIQLSVIGLAPGHTNILEVSSDMHSWTPVCTNCPATKTMTLTDTSAATQQTRFYRLIQLP